MRRPEQALQKSAVQLLQVYENRGLLAYCAVPNGGYRSKVEAAILAGMGVRSGAPDLIVWTRDAHSFGIELKAGKGSESDAQILFRSTLETLGHRVYICWSLEEIEAVLRLEKVPPIGTFQPVLEAAE